MTDQDKRVTNEEVPPVDVENDVSSSVPIPVKLRQNIQDSIRQAADDARKSRLSVNIAEEDAGPESEEKDAKRKNGQWNFPPAYRRKTRPSPEQVSDDEKLWAAAAHASTLFTFAMALGSVGILSLFTIFIPLGIYLAHRHKSEFVAHHALQAFAAQVVGIIGFAALFAAIFTVWMVLMVISILLIVVLIGIPLLLVVTLGGLIALGLTLLLPFGTLVYSMIAAVEAWNGKSYAYPWLGDWVDDQIYE